VTTSCIAPFSLKHMSLFPKWCYILAIYLHQVSSPVTPPLRYYNRYFKLYLKKHCTANLRLVSAICPWYIVIPVTYWRLELLGLRAGASIKEFLKTCGVPQAMHYIRGLCSPQLPGVSHGLYPLPFLFCLPFHRYE